VRQEQRLLVTLQHFPHVNLPRLQLTMRLPMLQQLRTTQSISMLAQSSAEQPLPAAGPTAAMGAAKVPALAEASQLQQLAQQEQQSNASGNKIFNTWQG